MAGNVKFIAEQGNNITYGPFVMQNGQLATDGFGHTSFAGIRVNVGPIEVLYGPRGNTSRFTLDCPSLLPLLLYYNYISSFGGSGSFLGLDLGSDGLTSSCEKKLSVEVPGVVNNQNLFITEYFFDQWEFLSNENTDTLFADPLIIGPIGAAQPVLNYNDKVVLSRLALGGGTIKQAIASCNSDVAGGTLHAPNNTAGSPWFGGTAGGSFQAPGSNSAPDIYGGTAPAQLAKEILKGQTEFLKPTQVLRHTSYRSANANYALSRSNEMRIYTPGQLLTEVGGGWTYNCPADIYSQIGSAELSVPPAIAVDESPYYTWGWLKKIGRHTVLSNFMVEIPVEYELGYWSNLRYALATNVQPGG